MCADVVDIQGRFVHWDSRLSFNFSSLLFAHMRNISKQPGRQVIKPGLVLLGLSGWLISIGLGLIEDADALFPPFTRGRRLSGVHFKAPGILATAASRSLCCAPPVIRLSQCKGR